MFNTFFFHGIDPGTTPGHGIPQRREGESCSSHFPAHVLCFPLPEEPQVAVAVAGLA